MEELEKESSFDRIMATLDANFQYDARVQLPSDFEGYFNLLQRTSGQTLLMFVADHEEAYRKLQHHKVELPASVPSWHLLRRASISKEQRQMVTLKAPSLEKKDVIEALYLLLGQDYKGGTWPMERKRFGFAPWRNNRAYVAEDYDDEEPWESGYVAARQWHHDRHLCFVREAYLRQVKGGRHAHIEQPREAKSWQTRALRDLPGRLTNFSQCRYWSSMSR